MPRMRFSTVALGLFCATFAGAHVLAGERINLTQRGEPVGVIALSDDPTSTERFAAEELQAYIERISGAVLPIVAESESELTTTVVVNVEELAGALPQASQVQRPRIFVGRAQPGQDLHAELADADVDAFVVRRIDGDLFLSGASDRATVYAVYDFLETELGCRWLGPGSTWEEIPERRTISLGRIDRFETPGMKYRQIGLRGSSSHEATTRWALKNKGNVGGHVPWPFEWMGRSRGTERPIVDFRGWSAVHSGPRTLIPGSPRSDPDQELFEQHPEWFALQEDGTRDGRWLCYSNEDVIELLADRLSQMLEERPHKEFVQLGAGDGLFRGACQCEECLRLDEPEIEGRTSRRETYTHRWLRFTNTVAERLAEAHPDRKLLVAAYESYQAPPAPEVVTPASNMIVDYYTWSGCRLHGFEHDDEAGLHARYRDWIEGWQSVTPGGLIMAEYLSRASMDRQAGPQPRRYVADIQYLAERDVVGYRAFINPVSWGLYGINRYVVAKALWDPDLDADELVADYCDHAFHEASEAMQRFIATIEAGMQQANCSSGKVHGFMTPQVMAEARRHLNAAHAAAGSDVVRRRLLSIEGHFRFQELASPAWRKYYHVLSRMGWRPADLEDLIPDPEPDEPLWLKLDRGSDDDLADLMRQAIAEGQAAIAFRNELHSQYPEGADVRFFRTLGHRLRGHVREEGSWYRLLAQLEEQP